jgi:uncharacterized membrane protein YfcA
MHFQRMGWTLAMGRGEARLDGMGEIDAWQYALVAAGALSVGIGKGGVPGVGNLAVVLLALALPARASVGVLLPIMISADVVAVTVYRRHADWRHILRLAPWVAAGIVLGYAVFGAMDDRGVKVLIGAILLGMAAAHFFRLRVRRQIGNDGPDRLLHSRLFTGATGLVAGFATMVANAAGPVAALYFIASGLPKYAFIGTAAWFFSLVNLSKVPLMMNLGIIHAESLRFSLSFMVYAVLGAAVAPAFVRFIPQKCFSARIWVFVVVGGLKLILS